MRPIMRRIGTMMGAVLIAALVSVAGAAGAGSPSKSQSSKKPAGGPSKPQSSKKLVWYGVEEYFGHAANSGEVNPVAGGCGSQDYKYTIRVRRVEDAKTERTLSLSLNWSGSGKAFTAGYRKETCSGSGGLEVNGAWTNADEKVWGAAFPCESKNLSNNFVFTCGAKPAIAFPRKIFVSQLRDGCSYSEESPGYRYSTWLAPQTDAVIEVKTDKSGLYWNFVPEPDVTISFTAKSSIPSLFRFTLDPVSRLPGYAMNARVDDSFFALFPSLQHLKGQYQNDSPDLIFDPANYKNRADWKVRSFGDVETVRFSRAETVTVTAMDYGAYGHLHADFKGICGGWMPVTIKWDKPPGSGKQRPPGITIPMDDNGNLIADRMEEKNNGLTPQVAYTGDPGSDDDDKPSGDRVPGDGLTTFEEYRGFMVKSGWGDCSNPLDVEHIRTDPAVKDIFIRADDPGMEKLVPRFEAVSGLAVHRICPQQYWSDDIREVNFTLQSGGWGGMELEGKTISQWSPQHGLHLINQRLEGGTDGVTSSIGPPRKVKWVKVDKAKCLKEGPEFLARVIFHELGHAIGIRHHGEGNIEGPVVILDVNGACPSGTVAVSVLGRKACKASWIAMRDQQNSGEQSCPMKYVWWSWYVPPGASLTSVRSKVTFKHGFLHLLSDSLPGYTGSIRRYRTDLDSLGLSAFCTSKKGTGINALPGDLNHAGDAVRGECANQIHVNDVR
jgi:hypothetical protein